MATVRGVGAGGGIAAVHGGSRRVRFGALAAFLLALAPAAWGEGRTDVRGLLAEARAYEHGEGVSRDPARALGLYCQGARQGDAEAQYSLGWMYANGRGAARDDGLAAYFFKLAAEQGHPQAARLLASMGEAPKGPPECMARREVARVAPAEEEALVPRSPAEKRVLDLVLRLAPQYGVRPRLALAVIRTESGFKPGAVSGKNAQGLMQLIPETSARFKVAKPFDPEQNLRGGLAYLRWLLAYFKGNVNLVAAAYNAGEGAVNRFRGIPPYAETRGYVRRIRELYAEDEHPYDESVTPPSPELPRIRVNG